MNPFGVAFSLINKSDLILVNHSGQVIDGGECRLLNTAAYMIHSAIHAARPDVNCAAHSHSIYGRTFCSLGRKLDTLTQDACAFHNDHVVYDSFNGVVLAEKEGKDIAKCLGDKKAALLQNHGLLTVGATIEEVSKLLQHYRAAERVTDFFFLFFSRPSFGLSRSRGAATPSSWPRLLLSHAARSQFMSAKKRRDTPIAPSALHERAGSVQSPCLM